MRRLYIGVRGVLIQVSDQDGTRHGQYELIPGGIRFLEWATEEFDCYWLTDLNKDGGHDCIREALEQALEGTAYQVDFDLLLEFVRTTAWETCKAEAIDLDSDFYWIDSHLDDISLALLRRRGLLDRLFQITKPTDFATIQCRLSPVN